ncbi:MAG: biotin--[acetyl-CoA-carboxylase] ligase [Lachnospiraceae bacterium]|nr:biotin--[acetyl-CoA-carboxylase] ligase [Lachnospiraceae bacterium]
MKTASIDQAKLKNAWKSDWIGKEMHYFDVTDSTNMQARRLAEEGSLHGTLVVAGSQQAGKGRSGRTWDSKPDNGIFMTLLLRPKIAPQNASMLTLVAALAVSKAIRKMTGLLVQIKWPNDIVYNGKKICGILTEMSAEVAHIHYVIVGIGINVTNTEFSEEISAVATSLFLESGKKTDRSELIAEVCAFFEQEYAVFCEKEDMSTLLKEYNAYLVNRHKQVRILDPKEPFEGKALGINARGELLVDVCGEEKKVSSGEVSVRGIYGYV